VEEDGWKHIEDTGEELEEEKDINGDGEDIPKELEIENTELESYGKNVEEDGWKQKEDTGEELEEEEDSTEENINGDGEEQPKEEEIEDTE